MLQKAGEVVNGNSPYDSRSILYLNKTHQAIIAGGNIFSLKVDEPWTWARSRHPIVLELLPAYSTGTVTMNEGDIDITFSVAPDQSLEGWHFQIVGMRTPYKITQHNASEVNAMIDSGFVDASGSYAFRAFKLDYEVFPGYIYVDSQNDKLDFEQTASTQLTATLIHGTYTPAAYLAHVVSKLNTAGTNIHSGTYDSVLKKFTITSTGAGSKILTLKGTGTNYLRSALPTLGFNMADASGALTYTSTYIINGLSRMIEPFKVHTDPGNDSKVTSSDTATMENDYPIAMTPEKLPDRFAKIEERNDGTVVVRFNAYPRVLTKCTLDWIPIPHDLQNNAYSIPKIPRKDIDALIHGAVTFILFDKNDGKWEGTLNMTRAQLEAMEKKNRSELFRTGQNFAQIIPRLDKMNRKVPLRYGYAVTSGSPTPVQGANAIISRQFTYADFQTGALTNTVTARQLPANHILNSVIVRLTQSFVGTSISALSLSVGIVGDTTKFINGFDLLGAIGTSDSALTVYFPAAATNMIFTITAVGANLSALSAGALDIHFNESLVAV